MDANLTKSKFRDSVRYINVQNNYSYFKNKPAKAFEDTEHDLDQ